MVVLDLTENTDHYQLLQIWAQIAHFQIVHYVNNSMICYGTNYIFYLPFNNFVAHEFSLPFELWLRFLEFIILKFELSGMSAHLSVDSLLPCTGLFLKVLMSRSCWTCCKRLMTDVWKLQSISYHTEVLKFTICFLSVLNNSYHSCLLSIWPETVLHNGFTFCSSCNPSTYPFS